MPISRDKLAPMHGLVLACIAFVLLFLGWLHSYLRNTRSYESKLNIERMSGYGRVDMDALRNLSHTSSKTTIFWPALQHYDRAGDGAQYPPFRSLLSLVSEWNPDSPDPPGEFHETLQHFNYGDPVERAMAEKYRNAEVPFKIYNVSGFTKVSRLWNDEYLEENMDSDTPHVEESNSNHFMYWNTHHRADGYVPPTEIVDLSFKKWLELAHRADDAKITSEAKHYYFMTGSPARDRGGNFISRDLKLFSTKTNNFFITDVRANKGIQCRFGMRGIISEAHYDSGRNMVAMLKGEKRYILNPPKACKQLGIISDTRHPSFRHSIIDWSDPVQAKSRGFQDVDAIDTIVRSGEVLYIPSYWVRLSFSHSSDFPELCTDVSFLLSFSLLLTQFHYIVSMKFSIQCNSRSGSPPGKQGEADINACFGDKVKTKYLRSLPK